MDSTWARIPQRAATALGRRGGWRTTCPLLFLGRRPRLATTLGRFSLEDSERLLSSPELPREQWLLYTDILGCSIRRFSISVIATCEDGPPRVKQGGGVKIQLSCMRTKNLELGVEAPDVLGVPWPKPVSLSLL